MSQQKNKKDNRDSDYGNSTDTQNAGAGKTENAFDSKESKDEAGTTTGTTFGKKDETSTTDTQKGTTPGSDKKNLGDLEQQISKSSTKSDFGSDQKKDKNYDEENRRLTGENEDTDERKSDGTTGTGLSNQQTDFRRGNQQGPDSRYDNPYGNEMNQRTEGTYDQQYRQQRGSDDDQQWGQSNDQQRYGQYGGEYGQWGNRSKSVLVNMQVSNGDNRMIKSDLDNMQASNGDNRSNSKDMVSMVVSNGDSNNTSVSDKIPDSSGVSRIMVNKIHISTADNMAIVARDNTLDMAINFPLKEIMVRETDTIKVRNMARVMDHNIVPDNIQAMELNMVHSTKIPMDKEIANGMILMKTGILQETFWIMIADLAEIMKEDVKKVTAVHLLRKEKETPIHRVVQQIEMKIINMANLLHVLMMKDLIKMTNDHHVVINRREIPCEMIAVA